MRPHGGRGGGGGASGGGAGVACATRNRGTQAWEGGDGGGRETGGQGGAFAMGPARRRGLCAAARSGAARACRFRRGARVLLQAVLHGLSGRRPASGLPARAFSHPSPWAMPRRNRVSVVLSQPPCLVIAMQVC
ncbi:hypothetical protein DA2_1253 [Desulfovibrio sp. A2]|nr:hypothetical protein DA2_1253 [Desulfovibrio sp. A2]